MNLAADLRCKIALMDEGEAQAVERKVQQLCDAERAVQGAHHGRRTILVDLLAQLEPGTIELVKED